MLTALIVDDESKARNILQHYIKAFIPEITDVHMAGSVDEAIHTLERFTPNIVFLDVEMPHKNGFDFLSSLPEILFDVIFITAYNQYAIQAIRFSALDYLLKPVDPDELRTAVQRHVEKAADIKAKQEMFRNLITNIEGNDVKKFKIAVPSSDGVHFFSVDDIVRLEADRSYTYIYLLRKKPFIASKTLRHFEEMLEEAGFIRTHKSHLINPKHIVRIAHDNEFMLLTDGSQVEVSRRKRDEVLKQLKIR